MSWQDAVKGSGRAGRWRRKYKGRVYYFPGGRGKSDREAYDAAVAAWEAKKLEIDRDAPRPYQTDHEAAIDQWEQVLAWCNQHGDRQHADIASQKLGSLRKRLTSPILRKLDRKDWFEALFDNPFSVDDKFNAEIKKSLDEFNKLPARERIESNFGPLATRSLETAETIEKLTQVSQILDGIGSNDITGSRTIITPIQAWDISPNQITKEIWRDRLEVQERKDVSNDKSLQACVERFLKDKQNQVAAGEVSVGRHYALKIHLTHFQDWRGKNTPVEEIDGTMLLRYHTALLDKVASSVWRRTTASHYLTSVKTFVRWLWTVDAIPSLPRVLDSKSSALKITKPLSPVVVFSKDEITQLLNHASERTKLYILLMLNIGATQKDISDLLVGEVDWVEGRIVRRRSKTADMENVPIVNYKLWPATFELLQKERYAASDDRVLRNNNGGPLWSEELTQEGKYQKNDNIKNAFARLAKVVGISKPLKSLKKTSATLLRGDSKYATLAGLFLGHAPTSMSERHYTQGPQNLLDQAILWLGEEYGLLELAQDTGPKKAAARPGDSKPDGSQR